MEDVLLCSLLVLLLSEPEVPMDNESDSKTGAPIGILACSAEGAALCYRTICLEGQKTLGEHMHPEVTMHTHCLGLYMEKLTNEPRNADWQGVAGLMQSSYDRLVEAGARVIVCPDNTIHQAYDLVKQRPGIRWLHIAGQVAELAREKNYARLAVLGTRYLMEGPVYGTTLEKYGIEARYPNEDERLRINRVIFSELVNGKFGVDSRSYFVGVINRLRKEGCHAVVLGCTEIPLLISESDSPIPILDSTRVLARAALKASQE